MMSFFGKLLVVVVFGFVVMAVVNRFFPATGNVAMVLPGLREGQLQANAGQAITWTMIVFGVSSFVGWRLVKR